jgi:hypothetical protein
VELSVDLHLADRGGSDNFSYRRSENQPPKIYAQNLRPVVGLRPTIHNCDFSHLGAILRRRQIGLIDILAVQRRFSLMQKTSGPCWLGSISSAEQTFV